MRAILQRPTTGTLRQVAPCQCCTGPKLPLQIPFLGVRTQLLSRGTTSRHRLAVQLRPQALGLFGGKKQKTAVKRETVIPEPSYAIPAVLLGVSALSAYEGITSAAVLTGILGAFLAFQATNVRFKFDDKSLEVLVGKEQRESQNAFVGGENRWAFDTFTNWEFWWPGFPVLVYFKEVQTKPEGQIHFFPIIMNGKQLYDVMVERCGPSQNSGPK